MLQKGLILEAVIKGKVNGAITFMELMGDEIHPIMKAQLEFLIEEMNEILEITNELNVADKN